MVVEATVIKALFIAIMLIAARGVASAQSRDTAHIPELRHGAIEIGMAGSLTAVETVSYATLTLRLGRFFGLGRGLLSVELDNSYSRIGSLDRLEISPLITFSYGFGSAYPYIGIGGGLREEFFGSFAQARYPVGADAGVRLLAADNLAIRMDYEFRRLLSDPVADYSEHRLMLGISVLLGN